MTIDPTTLESPFPTQAPPGWPSCRECGCWDWNACWHEDVGACWWVEPDLCSHCHYARQNPQDAESGALDGPQ